VPLPLPTPVRSARYRWDATGTALIGSGEAVWAQRHPGEIYLRLYDLNLDDPKAVLAFANTYGVLDGYEVHLRLLGKTDRRLPNEEAEEKRIFAADSELRRLEDEWSVTITLLESFAFAKNCINDLTNAWRIVKGDLEPDLRLFKELRTIAESRLAPRLAPRLRHDYLDAQHLLCTGLDLLLRGFHPTIHKGSGAHDVPEFPLTYEQLSEPYWIDPRSREVPIDLDIPASPALLETRKAPRTEGLAEICALELYNHIAGYEVYRQCQNEPCNQTFVTQYGRAEHGQSRRQGVMYCSHACAQAQAQRMYRRRKRTRLQESDPT
jgi:hypothetical protein